MLPLTVKLRALQDAQEARLGDDPSKFGEWVGYAVWDEHGRIGTVVGNRLPRSGSRIPPSALAARNGLFRTRVVLISETEVDHCDAHQRRVRLKLDHAPHRQQSADRRGRLVTASGSAMTTRPVTPSPDHHRTDRPPRRHYRPPRRDSPKNHTCAPSPATPRRRLASLPHRQMYGRQS